MPRILLLPLAMLSLILVTGCATTGPKPGTGDISFRLHWDGPADLDLHVEDPHGRHVGLEVHIGTGDWEEMQQQLLEYRRQELELADVPKGILDIDCNADPSRVCEDPIENIFWPAGTAPRGDYKVWVYHFQNVTGEGPVPYTLEIRRGNTVTRTLRGTVDRESPRSGDLEVVY